MSRSSPIAFNTTTTRVSDAQYSATRQAKGTQRPLKKLEAATAWSPCYLCLDSGSVGSYSSLVVVRLLMREIWVWETEMADEDQDQAEADVEAGLQSLPSQSDPHERIPHESELLPCHYFDFFYGVSCSSLIATLLGRLRLRVDDATDQFQNITQAMFGDRRYCTFSGVLRPMYNSRHLANAVHDITMKHSINTTECGGNDQLFRTPSAVFSPECENNMQAQTCIVVRVYRDNSLSHEQSLRTFRSGPIDTEKAEHRDVPLSDQLDLTICEVLEAATATPRFFSRLERSIGTETVKLIDAGITELNPTKNAIQDHQFSHRGSNSSEEEHRGSNSSEEHCREKVGRRRGFVVQRSWRQLRAELPRPDFNIERSIAEDPALFLNIGWRRLVDEENRGVLKELYRNAPIDYFGHSLQSSSRSDDEEISRQVSGSGYFHVRLRPNLRLNGSFKRGSRINASSFDAIHDGIVDAVNSDEELRSDLRRAAKELVRRRRARQAMGGPRWEVFVGNAEKIDDGAGNGKG